MNGCSKLKSIDLSPLKNVTSIPRNFLADCTSLEYVDLSPLKKVKTIDAGFLGDCTSIKTVDFSGMDSLEAVAVDFAKWIPHKDSVVVEGPDFVKNAMKDEPVEL
jgi:hypothetical protein